MRGNGRNASVYAEEPFGGLILHSLKGLYQGLLSDAVVPDACSPEEKRANAGNVEESEVAGGHAALGVGEHAHAAESGEGFVALGTDVVFEGEGRVEDDAEPAHGE